MRGLRTTLALIVVLAGLGAYIYFVASKQDPNPTPKQDKVFAGLQPDKIEEITIKSESGDVTTLKKSGDAWQVAAPITAKASESDVSSITSALESADIARVLEENPTDLKEYGLDAPRIDVEFKSSDSKSSGHLFIGGKTATGGNLYAKRADQKRVVLIPGTHEASFNKTTFDLRDKSIMAFKREAVDGLDVTVDGKSFTMAKTAGDGDNSWKLTKPIAARADASSAEGLVGHLETAQMKSVVTTTATPEDLKKYGLDKPSVSVTLMMGSARATLALGGKMGDDAFYARDTSKQTVVTVDKALADDVKKGIDDYRRRDLFDFRAFSATQVELIRGGKTYTFERVKAKDGNGPDTWKRTTPSAADADREKVETLLTGLADVRAQSFVESKAGTGLDAPTLTVHAKFEDGKKEERVSFAKKDKDVFAETVDPGAMKIEPGRLDEALKTLDELSK